MRFPLKKARVGSAVYTRTMIISKIFEDQGRNPVG